MIYSTTTGYALRALAYMTALPEGAPATPGRIGRACGIPSSYLAKVLQVLRREGWVLSRRGASGGYVLSALAGTVTVMDVVERLDDPKRSPLRNCVMGLSTCSDKAPCLVHKEWRRAADALKKRLESHFLKDLTRHSFPDLKFRRGKKVFASALRAMFPGV